jgi:hypothetical protein
MILMSAKTQVMAAYVVIVAIASMGESLLAHGHCRQCRRSLKAVGQI